MTEQEILNRLKPIIAQRLNATAPEITMDASFTHDLGADSIDMADIIMFSESALNCTVPNERYKTIQTVRDLVVCLFSVLNPKQSTAVLWLAVSKQKNLVGMKQRSQRTK